MIEINSKSKEIYLESRYGVKNRCLFLNSKFSRIWIPKSVSLFCGLNEGKYIHFLNDEKEWSFYCNDDPDGFLIHARDKSKKLFLSNKALVILILKTSGFHNEKKFYVEKTKTMQGDCHVFYLNPNI